MRSISAARPLRLPRTTPSSSRCRLMPPPSLIRGLDVPTEFRAIVNAHFRIEPPPEQPPILGVLNGTVEWIFAFPGRLSVTISAGDRLVDTPREELAKSDLGGGRERDRAAGGIAAAGRSCASAAPLLPRRRRRMQSGRARKPRGAIWCWPAIGPIPACPPPSKARSAPATAPPNSSPAAKCKLRMSECVPNERDAISTGPSSAATAGAAGDASAPTAICCSSWRPTPPSRPNMCCCGIISASRSTPRWSQDRRLSAPHPGRAWRLAAVPRRRIRHERDGEGLFRAQDDRRRRRRHRICAAPARRSGCAAAPSAANVFTRFLLALYGIVPWRAVPVMPVEIMLLPKWFPFHLDKISLLEPHRHRAASGADGEEAARAERQGRRASTNCFSSRRNRSGRRRRRRSRRRRGSGSSAASTMCCARRSRCFPSACGRAPSTAPWPGSASG